jgi:hypothetical protein
MEMFVLMVVILMSALVITYNKEIYLYLCLVLGSLLKDIQSKVEKLFKKGE